MEAVALDLDGAAVAHAVAARHVGLEAEEAAQLALAAEPGDRVHHRIGAAAEHGLARLHLAARDHRIEQLGDEPVMTVTAVVGRRRHPRDRLEVRQTRERRAVAAAEQQPHGFAGRVTFAREQEERREADATGDADRIVDVRGERSPERAGHDDLFADRDIEQRVGARADALQQEAAPAAVGCPVVERERSRQQHRPPGRRAQHVELARAGLRDRAVDGDRPRAAAEITPLCNALELGLHCRSA